MSSGPLEELVRRARSRIERLTPAQAWSAAQAGACIVDVRSRPTHVVPGSLLVPRTVLEWRLAADSDSRSPFAPGTDERVLVLCDHGESSSLAAANLVELGFTRAGDITGGFAAWVAAGLPVVPAPGPEPGLPGTAPPAPSLD